MSWREFGDWKHDALAALRRRNATQSKPFDELIGAYNDALAGEREQKRRREELEREVIILRHELATSAVDQPGDAPEAVRKLQQKSAKLQDELTERYRKASESDDETRRLRRESRTRAPSSAPRGRAARARDAEAAGARAEAALELLRGEHARARAQLAARARSATRCGGRTTSSCCACSRTRTSSWPR